MVCLSPAKTKDEQILEEDLEKRLSIDAGVFRDRNIGTPQKPDDRPLYKRMFPYAGLRYMQGNPLGKYSSTANQEPILSQRYRTKDGLHPSYRIEANNGRLKLEPSELKFNQYSLN